MVVQVIEIGEGTDGNSNNPLNPLGAATRTRLHERLLAAQRDPSVTSIVLKGQSRNFSAGADLTEFDTLHEKQIAIGMVGLCQFVEGAALSPRERAQQKPIVAAIEGVALGGGCELALACHYRVAAPSALLGLPEVTVGVIPGAGGTQRLPRLIGLVPAMDMICTGNPVSAKKALELGLVNAVVSNNTTRLLVDCAKAWAEWAELMPLAPQRLSTLSSQESPDQVAKIIAATISNKKNRKTFPPVDKGGECVQRALRAVQASALPFDEGMIVEGTEFYKAVDSIQGRARRHSFFAVRAAAKTSSSSTSTSTMTLRSHPLLSSSNSKSCDVGVIGAGTMGSSIALVLLQAGYVVYLVDVQEAALKKGVQFLNRTLDSFVMKQKMSAANVASLKKKLRFTTQLEDLKSCRLVVEAIVENMTIKKTIFSKLDQVTPAGALLLSNTSTLDIDEMATSLSPSRRGNFAGWHFFSPAHVMKLVEIVVGKETSSQTVALLKIITKRIKKIGVTVGNCDGFVGNRMLNPYTSEMVMLLAEGGGSTTVESIDRAIFKFGMALGPFVMSDLAGNDIGYFIRKERGLVRDPKTKTVGPKRTPRLRYTELADDLVTELGRIGQKAGKVRKESMYYTCIRIMYAYLFSSFFVDDAT